MNSLICRFVIDVEERSLWDCLFPSHTVFRKRIGTVFWRPSARIAKEHREGCYIYNTYSMWNVAHSMKYSFEM
jgi:hypothetical protein